MTAIYHLARVHSMAYATNLQEVSIINTNLHSDMGPFTPQFEYPGVLQIPKNVFLRTNLVEQLTARAHLTNAISYYERARKVILNDTTNRWLIRPIYLGYAWCLEQSGDREKAKEAYREALRRSWQIEVEGDDTFKQKMQWAWDNLKRGQNPLKRQKRYLGICYSEEIISYLLKLLDPVKDSKEIAKLKDAQKELSAMGRVVTPILVGLKENAQLSKLIDPTAAVEFDLDGSGLPRRWQWITPEAAWLVYDHQHSGRITSGLQLFGNVTFWIFWRDGYQALGSLDDNANGALEGNELNFLSLWRDSNSNGFSESDEVHPVKDYGIVSIRVTGQSEIQGTLGNPAGVIFQDGSSWPTFDWIAKQTGHVLTATQ